MAQTRPWASAGTLVIGNNSPISNTASPRILLFDIETAPISGYAWTMYEANIVSVDTPTYMLSYSAKWLGESKQTTRALPDFSLYKKNRKSDLELVKDLWKMMDEADVIIAHNADFDIKKSNARFLANGLPPPSPYKTLCTLKIARKHFKFDSNKLDSLGGYLGVGRKLKHTGIHLWMGCISGDMKAWNIMKKYNAQDVLLLEQCYLKLRAWATTHPNLTIYHKEEACPTCRSTSIIRRGFNFSKAGAAQRMQCRSCYAWFSGPKVRCKNA